MNVPPENRLEEPPGATFLHDESHSAPPPSPGFWNCPTDLNAIPTTVAPPATPLAILEKLGPSPFPRGGFPLIGFLATTYEKITRYALNGG